VLAFSVIYDWRMNGKAVSLASRMPRIGQAYAAPTDATPRKGVICPTEPAPPTAVATRATGTAN
jgi:soluble lytic murein transglycosylase